MIIAPPAPAALPPDHPWGSPSLPQVPASKDKAHLCEGLCLVQHGVGSLLEGPGSLGDHRLPGNDHLLQGLCLQA